MVDTRGRDSILLWHQVPGMRDHLDLRCVRYSGVGKCPGYTPAVLLQLASPALGPKEHHGSVHACVWTWAMIELVARYLSSSYHVAYHDMSHKMFHISIRPDRTSRFTGRPPQRTSEPVVLLRSIVYTCLMLVL